MKNVRLKFLSGSEYQFSCCDISFDKKLNTLKVFDFLKKKVIFVCSLNVLEAILFYD